MRAYGMAAAAAASLVVGCGGKTDSSHGGVDGGSAGRDAASVLSGAASIAGASEGGSIESPGYATDDVASPAGSADSEVTAAPRGGTGGATASASHAAGNSDGPARGGAGGSGGGGAVAHTGGTFAAGGSDGLAGVPGASAGAGMPGTIGSAGSRPVGGAAGASGIPGFGATAGTENQADPHLDPMGDAESPGMDLLEARVFAGADTLSVAIRLAEPSQPARGFVSVEFDADGSPARLEFGQSGGTWMVMWFDNERTVVFDGCATVRVDEASGTVIVELPGELLPRTSELTFGVSTSSLGAGSDSMASASIPTEAAPMPVNGGQAPCGEWAEPIWHSTMAFRDLSLGFDFGCGLDLEGEVVCWGSADALAALGPAPAGPFAQIVASNGWFQSDFACALRDDGSVACWGDRAPGFNGLFQKLGEPFGCVLNERGDLECMPWSSADEDAQTYFAGPFTDVMGSSALGCGIAADSSIQCFNATAIPAGNDFVALAPCDGSGPCGLHADGTGSCANGSNPPGVLREMVGASGQGGNVNINCGLDLDGIPVCWGRAGLSQYVHPGPFEHLEMSPTGEAICGVNADRTVTCWVKTLLAGYPEYAVDVP